VYRSALFLSGELNRVTLQTSPVGSSGTATVAASSAANLVSMPITGCLAAGEALSGIRPGFALSRLGWLCRDDHLWVESHRLLAYGLGLLVRHGVTPCCEIPVFHHGRWVLLDDNGDVVPIEADGQGFEVAS